MSLDCLNNIIGLSATACTCWDAEKPADFTALNASSSGLYIMQPDTVPVRWTNSAADCENGGIWSLAINARTQAVRDFLSDYLAATQSVKEEQFLPFTTIGDDYYKSGVLNSDALAGIWLEPYEIKGAKLRIDSVQIAFWSGISAPVAITINIYSSLDFSTVLATSEATVSANKTFYTATFSTPFIKDLGDVRADLNERFYIVYEMPAGARPVNNQTEKGCSCSGSQKYHKNPYLQVLTLGGVQASHPTTLTEPTTSSADMQGLRLNASLECDYYSWLCDLAQKPAAVTVASGQRLRLGMALADGLQAKAIINLVDSILVSGRINHYSMVLDPKQLYQIKGHYLKIYRAAINNLVYYMPADVSDCLVCQKNKRLIKSQILV
mgnify:CR=1 FL=1